MYHVSVYRSILNSADSLLATGLDSLVAWGLALERGASSGIVLEGVVGVLAIFLRRERARFLLGLCDAARAGDRHAAEAWQARLLPFIEFFGLEPNPVPVKALLQRGGIGHGLRLPLLPLSQAHHALADELAVAARTLELQSAREPRAA